MKLVQSEEIKNQLCDLWPHLKVRALWKTVDLCIVSDREYVLPTLNDLVPHLNRAWDKLPRTRRSMFECEDSAIVTCGRLREYRANEAHSLPVNQRRNFPVGFCHGSRFQYYGEQGHTPLICSVEEGVYLADPILKMVWKADPSQDHVFFVWM